MNDKVYLITLQIRQSDKLPDCSPVKVEAMFIDLHFKNGVPTYRRIKDVLQQSHKILLNGLDINGHPEAGHRNEFDGGRVVVALDQLWDAAY